MYGLFVVLGMLSSLLVVRSLRSTGGSPETRDQRIQAAAIVGAGVGAHLAHALPTALGWLEHAPLVGAEVTGLERLGGRSILGGLLGGWVAVELTKWRLGRRQSLSASMAAPLAMALCWGRVGCLVTGCCGGIEYSGPGAWRDAAGVARYPVQGVEVVFHLLAFLWLYRRARGGRANDLDLVGYLASYGLLRFALEFLRWHGVFAWGLSWYQWLSALLFVPAFLLWVTRFARQGASFAPRQEHLEPESGRIQGADSDRANA